MEIGVIVVQTQGWGQTFLEAGVTILGLIITQAVVISLFRKGELKRLDPFVVRCCAEYGAAVGQIKWQLNSKLPLSTFPAYEASYERLSLIAPDKIHLAMERIQSDIVWCMDSVASGDEEAFQEHLLSLFQGQMRFTQEARGFLEQEKKVHRATPMITAEDLALYESSVTEN